MRYPRVTVVAVVAGNVVGCSLFVDTSGLLHEGQRPSAAVLADGGGPDGRAPDIDDAAPPSPPPEVVELPGPVAHWAFDEGGGSTAVDATGNGHDGIILGGVWVEDRHGEPGRALLLESEGAEGGHGHVSIAGAPAFDRPEGAAFTISAWVRFAATPGHDVLFDVECDVEEKSYDLEFNDGGLTYYDGVEHVAWARVPSVVGEWRHVGVAVDGAKASTYFDGMRVGEGVADTSPCVAKRIYLGRYVDVAIDDVRFYGVALDDAQMMAEKNR